jgi:PAS domain S-box-containing protein
LNGEHAEAILSTVRQPLVVLDGALSVLTANRAFYSTFDVHPDETEGHRIYDLGNGQWNIAALRTLLEDILPRDGEVVDYRVDHVFERIGHRIMILNARRMQRDGQVDRILVAIDDVTERERALWEVEGLKEFAQKIVDASRDAVLVLGWDLRVKTANDKFYRSFRVSPEETEGRLVYELGNGQWDIPQLRELLEEILPRDYAFDDFVVEHRFEQIGQRTMILNARRIDHIQFILLAIEDVTAARRAAADMKEPAARAAFLLRLSDGLRFERDPDAMAARALGMLRQHLDLDRAYVVNVRGAEVPGEVLAHSSVAGLPPMPSRLLPADLHLLVDAQPAGPRVIPDIRKVPHHPNTRRKTQARHALGAAIVAPLHRGTEGTTWALVAGARHPRDWTDAEASLVAETAERIWTAIERARADSARRASEERYGALFETIDQGFCIVEVSHRGPRPDYRVVEANPAFFVKTGFNADIVGRWMREAIPELEEHWYEIYGRVSTTGRPARFEQGSAALQRWFDVYAFRFGAPQEQRVAILFNDISERKRQEDALRESEERFRRFGDASSDVLWIRDARTMKWQYLTRAYEEIYGTARDRAISGDDYRDWLNLIMPEDRDAVDSAVQRVRTGDHVTFEYRVKRPLDGEIRWLRNSDFPITDEQGRITHIGGIGHDLTELRETELRLKTLMEGIPQLVWRSRANGLWTWASPQWVAFTGLDSERSTGLGWLDALHPDDRASAVHFWEQAGQSGRLEMEARIRRASDGEYYWFQWRATPVRNAEGQITEWLGTSTDVNEMRKMQERQQVLVAELQHRTRNLIAVVRSVAQQTMNSSEDLHGFWQDFRHRLAALSRVQSLLSQASDTQITIGSLLQSEFEALGPESVPGRIETRGPEVALRNSMVQTLALALHELATNARKYGALSEPDGRLEVLWDIGADTRGNSVLILNWTESLQIARSSAGGVPRHGGYGRELIERALPYSLGAETSYELSDTGVKCRVSLPLKEREPHH